MRKLVPSLLLLALAAAPAVAGAGWIVEGSVGQGWEFQPDRVKQPTNVMLTPGYAVASLLTLELGVLSSFENARHARFDVQLRPMAEISAPLFPLYGKAILGITGLSASPVKIQYGGALGWRLALAGLGLFLEVGVLPTNVQVVDSAGSKVNKLIWIGEGRLGLRLG
jgi:hypothetical protein